MIDTHSHMYLSQFDDDRDLAIQRAINEGVKAILLPNIEMASVEPLMKLCTDYPNYCFPMAGLHPTNVKDDYKIQLEDIVTQVQKHNIVAIGETGIDLYWDKTTLTEQIIAFEFQINLALEHNLPIVIHARDSIEEIFDVLKNFKTQPLTGVFHCFSGTKEQAQQAIEYGMYLGIGGVATFKNGGLTEIIKDTPTEKIVVETDSPFLAPAPHRGKRNETSYLKLIVEKIATIKQLSFQEVANITTENALYLFPKIKLNNLYQKK